MSDLRHSEAGVAGRDAAVRRVLDHYAFFRTGGEALQDALIRSANLVRPENGQTLIEAGRPCGDVVLVGKGEVRVYVAGASGREVTLYHVRNGETCPVNLSAAMLGVGAFAHAVAQDDLEALTFSADVFRSLGELHNELGGFLFTATVARFGEVIALVREITTRRVDHRLADYLVRRFDQSPKEPPVVNVTQRTIALELGTAREVVSRRLQELEALGAVQLGRGQITLADREALFSVVDSSS